MRLTIALLLPLAALAAVEADVITITAPVDEAPMLHRPMTCGEQDVGALLRTLPGVDAVRMGGRAVDPVLRGLQGDRIAVLLDGGMAFGGCPNRMDPPTALAMAELYQAIRVELGVSSLAFGAAAPAGSVRFERRALPDQGPQGGSHVAYTDNGEALSVAGDAAYGWQQDWAMGVRAAYQTGDDYQAGDGSSVPAGHQQAAIGADVRWRTPDDWRLRLSADLRRGEDIDFPGARMDAVVDDSDHVGLHLDREWQSGNWRAVSVSLSAVAVDHVMDNFSLRPVPRPGGNPMYMQTRADVLTITAVAQADLRLAERDLRWGVDLVQVEREASRSSGPTASVPMLQARMWPELRQVRGGAFAEMDLLAAEQRTLLLGLRLDLATADADTAGRPAAGGSPDSLYRSYYGHDSSAADLQWLPQALCRYQQRGSGPLRRWHVGLSRSMRAGDASEVFLAAGHGNPSMRWIGDPGIDAEIHQQVDAGLSLGPEDWNLELSGSVNNVDSFILRDRARGQAGVLLADGATIYRNVDARLYALEASSWWRPLPALDLQADLAWTRGENRSDDRPLAQIPPLGGQLAASWSWQRPQVQFGLRLCWQDEQDRVDDDASTGSGQDLGPTRAWAVLDCWLQASPRPGLDLGLGVDNVFDRHYARHLNKSDLFGASGERVPEPGTSVWLRMDWRF